MTRTTLTEAVTAGTAAVAGESTGKLLVTLITPGIGSGGYYAPEVLESAAADKVWPAGTHCFVNHPSESENYDRPERDIDDLAAVLVEDARWTGTGLVAEARLFPHKRYLEDMAEAVGMSIRASAEVSEGEHAGRRMPIIDKLVEGISVDFVTRAGRGGSFQVAESVPRPTVVNESAVRRGVSEATANETREQLQSALVQAYGAEKTWLWVRDFDDATVWFEVETPDDRGTWQQSYTLNDDGAVLSGERVEVRPETKYVPIGTPVTTSTATEGASSPTHVPPVSPAGSHPQESLEDTMPQIEEAELGRLREAAGRVTALESERDTAAQRADTAEAALAEATKRATARPVVTGVIAESTSIPAALVAGVVEAVLAGLTADTDDAGIKAAAEAARTAKETEVATIAESLGAGRITGFGGTSGPKGATTADFDNAVAEAFGRPVQTQEA